MGRPTSKLRAIDLYSGIGGWSLGLAMAGLEVVASYEWWAVANNTNQKNNGHKTTEVDIRALDLASLPKDIDVVVGSPPCTQFSFANRGGSGDISDGLKDIAKFLEVVDFVKPRFWAMENVPRVAGILEAELREGGGLEQYAHLRPSIEVVDMAGWGVPQRRKRCIAGNFDFELLYSYRAKTPDRTLGSIIEALNSPVVVDQIYKLQVDASSLCDHVVEEFLSPEEERMNRELKAYHPVYNNMEFPDPLERSARTITATCTRVSRESIVVEAPEKRGRYRRLTVRERGCLQGFPVTYQFFGKSYSQKLKMIGNAVPPLFTFYVAQAICQRTDEMLVSPDIGIHTFESPSEIPVKTLPDGQGYSYSETRRFRAALPHLRFKSGVRFELANAFCDNELSWGVSFFYGNSKDIRQLPLDDDLQSFCLKQLPGQELLADIKSALVRLETVLGATDANTLQQVWAHSVEHRFHPYDVVDVLGEAAAEIIEIVKREPGVADDVVARVLTLNGVNLGYKKLLSHSGAVLSGLIVGAEANAILHGAIFNQNSLTH